MYKGKTLEPGDEVKVREAGGEFSVRYFEDGPDKDEGGIFITVANDEGEIEGCLWNERERCWDAE